MQRTPKWRLVMTALMALLMHVVFFFVAVRAEDEGDLVFIGVCGALLMMLFIAILVGVAKDFGRDWPLTDIDPGDYNVATVLPTIRREMVSLVLRLEHPSHRGGEADDGCWYRLYEFPCKAFEEERLISTGFTGTLVVTEAPPFKRLRLRQTATGAQ